MKKFIFLISIITLLSACESRYRYACQNPDNWDKDYCKKPKCEVSRECPEHIFKGESGVVSYSAPSCSQCKGTEK